MTDPARALTARDDDAIALDQKLRFFPLAAERGEGALLFEPGGRQLIDFSAGWGAAGIGYAHPAVVRAVTQAVRTMPGASVLSGTHEPVVGLAEQLQRLTPIAGDASTVYIGLSGTDANSAVVRAIRAQGGAAGRKLLAFENSYHGGFGPAQSVSGIAAVDGKPVGDDVILVPYPDVDAVASAFQQYDIAAIFVESIMCDGGLIIPPTGFLQRLRELTIANGALLVIDEVKVGMGRTGRLYAYEHEGIRPDIVTVGKGLGGGLPVSAAIGPAEVLGREPAASLLTLAGNPVSAAAGQAVLSVVAAPGFSDRVHDRGRLLGQLLRQLHDRHVLVGSVRSCGLVGGIELRAADGLPASVATAKVMFRAWQLGLVVYCVGEHSSVIELTPSLLITESQLTRGFEILSQALEDVDAGKVVDDDIRDFAGW